MKKINIFFEAIGLFLTFAVNASVECPANITCNYDEGLCDQSTIWYLTDQSVSNYFPGEKIFELSEIASFKVNPPDNQQVKYTMVCYYKQPSSIIPIMIRTHVNTLVGDNWVFSGFNRWFAKCSNIKDLSACAGEK